MSNKSDTDDTDEDDWENANTFELNDTGETSGGATGETSGGVTDRTGGAGAWTTPEKTTNTMQNMTPHLILEAPDREPNKTPSSMSTLTDKQENENIQGGVDLPLGESVVVADIDTKALHKELENAAEAAEATDAAEAKSSRKNREVLWRF